MGTISKLDQAAFLIFILVFMSCDFEVGTNVSCKDCGRICTKFYEKVPMGEREDQVRVSLRLVQGCGSNGQLQRVDRQSLYGANLYKLLNVQYTVIYMYPLVDCLIKSGGHGLL